MKSWDELVEEGKELPDPYVRARHNKKYKEKNIVKVIDSKDENYNLSGVISKIEDRGYLVTINEKDYLYKEYELEKLDDIY